MSSSDGSPGGARPDDVSRPYGPPAALPPGSYASGPYPPGPYTSAPEGYRAPSNASALVLTILSGVAVLFCAGVFVIPALVLGILGLTRQATDPEGSRRYSRWGWWAFGVGVVLTVIAVIAVVGLFFAFASDSGSGGTPTFDGY